MKRVLAIWLPNWPVQRLASNKLELRGQADDRGALKRLAQWCHRFAPTVGLEDSESPDTLLLDATNLAPLYGSEQQLVVQVRQGLDRLDLDARLAIADTIGAAWALAHFENPPPSKGGVREGIARDEDPIADDSDASASTPSPSPSPQGRGILPLPIAALRLPDDLPETLHHLGVHRIEDLLSLPRDQLRSRFGPLLATRIDQAFGAAREVFAAVDPPEEFVVEQVLEYPLARQDAIGQVVQSLLGRLAWLLAARCAGALRLACRFDCEGAPAVELQASLFQPSASARHLLEIVELGMERLRLSGPVAAVTVHAYSHAPLAQRQGALFDEDRSLNSSLRLSALVDRLAGRLGREAVVRCRLEKEAQPELAYREEPLVGSPRRTHRPLKRVVARRHTFGPLDRPLHLLDRPAPLQTVSVVPDGPPIRFRRGGRQHQIARQWGPERIETGWWRGQSARRDYYRVETTEGRRFWLYRRRRDGRWFLHGVYE